MYLTETRSFDVIKAQYRYKLKAYMGSFTSLILVQLLAMLFSIGGSSQMGGSSSTGISYDISVYSGNLVLAFTFMWIFITAITVTTKPYRYDDFAFISNRQTSNLSNILFLVTASFIGGASAVLSGYLLKVIMLFYYGSENIIQSYNSTPFDVIGGIVGASFYLILIGSLGYLVGMLTQLHSLFKWVLPALFLGFLFLGDRINGFEGVIEFINRVFVSEEMLLVFILKVILFSGCLFLVTMWMTNRMEVRK
ncbi:hypothetical protein GCM10008967_35990 [Bacillus carboniphilus]|uniref:ABC transporter permease n=2 Tax=Bacillus carboniphilus TaxID=86663 RepID=A0ABN0WN77_9BACI